MRRISLDLAAAATTATLRRAAAFAATAAALLLPSGATAQVTLSGRVTDSSGGALPGTTVTATSEQTGLVQTSITDDTGGYVFVSLTRPAIRPADSAR